MLKAVFPAFLLACVLKVLFSISLLSSLLKAVFPAFLLASLLKAALSAFLLACVLKVLFSAYLLSSLLKAVFSAFLSDSAFFALLLFTLSVTLPVLPLPPLLLEPFELPPEPPFEVPVPFLAVELPVFAPFMFKEDNPFPCENITLPSFSHLPSAFTLCPSGVVVFTDKPPPSGLK